MQDDFIDLRNESEAKYMFKTNTMCNFWLKVSVGYPNVGKGALKKLLLFPRKYVNLDSHTLHVKTEIQQKTILDALFLQRNQEFSIWSKTLHKTKNHPEICSLLCAADAKSE